MSNYKGVAILCEIKEGNLSPSTAELLGGARKIADELEENLSAIIAGCDVSGLGQDAIALGADKVYMIEDALLEDYRTDAYVAVMAKAIDKIMPQIVLMGQTTIGRDLVPKLAARLNTAATMDCVALSIDPDSKRLLQTKPVYGGNALAVFINDCDPQIVTVRNKVMTPQKPDSSRTGEVITIETELDPSDIKTALLDKVREKVEGIRLEDAPVVISGGRGIGGPEGFEQLAELAKLLNGAVGASRPVCDSGWISDTSQVGLTGKIIAPDLYLAIGISGSSQHMAGCSGAKNIVVINKDPEANIFREAHYGVVGDWKKVFPVFVKKVKELLE